MPWLAELRFDSRHCHFRNVVVFVFIKAVLFQSLNEKDSTTKVPLK